jgi:hypothetical protein
VFYTNYREIWCHQRQVLSPDLPKEPKMKQSDELRKLIGDKSARRNESFRRATASSNDLPSLQLRLRWHHDVGRWRGARGSEP